MVGVRFLSGRPVKNDELEQAGMRLLIFVYVLKWTRGIYYIILVLLGIGYLGGKPVYCLGTLFTKIKTTSWQIDRNMFLNVCSQAPWHTTSQDQLWRSNDSLGNMDLQGVLYLGRLLVMLHGNFVL